LYTSREGGLSSQGSAKQILKALSRREAS